MKNLNVTHMIGRAIDGTTLSHTVVGYRIESSLKRLATARGFVGKFEVKHETLPCHDKGWDKPTTRPYKPHKKKPPRIYPIAPGGRLIQVSVMDYRPLTPGQFDAMRLIRSVSPSHHQTIGYDLGDGHGWMIHNSFSLHRAKRLVRAGYIVYQLLAEVRYA